MKNIILVDIDGTISNPKERLHFLDKKDWKSFYEACHEDTGHEDIISMIQLYWNTPSYEIVFCTGRVESVRKKTEDWIQNNCYFPRGTYTLLMRKDGDNRHDTIIKPEIVRAEGISLDNIFIVLEDRNSMVEKWRNLGVRCLQVQEGDF